MKRHILTVLLILTFLIGGVQTTVAQTDPAPTRGNAVPLEMLPDDLKGVDVRDYYIAAAGRPAGRIRTVIGHVVVEHQDTGQAYFAAVGDTIYKNDVVFTLKDSRCRLKFTTDDIITMGDNARIGIEEYIDDRVQKKKTSIFSMLRGKAMFYALRLFKYRTTSSQVKTPTAIIGVRGTQFGVEVRKAGDEMASSRPIYLADASDADFRYLLSQEGPLPDPLNLITIVHCGEGMVGVTSTPGGLGTGQFGTAGPTGPGPGPAPGPSPGPTPGPTPGPAPGPAPGPIPPAPSPGSPGVIQPTPETILIAGQSLDITDAGAGNVYQTPPDVWSGFTQATDAPDPEATPDQGQPTAPSTGDAGTSTTPSATDTGATGATDTSVIDNSQDITQNTTTLAQETQSTATQGYFTGMLIDRDSSPYIDNLYVSSSRQDFNATVIRANGIYDTSGFIDGNPDAGFVNANPTLKQVAVETGLVSADNLVLPVTKGAIGSNDYMDWGYWYVANTFIINSIVHDLWHKGYYIAGYPTPDANVAGISGTYSGPAYGTYYSPSASPPNGIDMTGSFSCDVNGSAGTISNFVMSVTGGGRVAFISGASGTLNSSSFDINPGTGTWELGPTGSTAAAVYKSSHGSLYGPNGEHIGGAWGMKTDPYNGAEGIFQGNKQ